MKNINEDKAMAELFYNIYIGCLKYKNENQKKIISCDSFYDKFKYFSEKYIDNKDQKS